MPASAAGAARPPECFTVNPSPLYSSRNAAGRVRRRAVENFHPTAAHGYRMSRKLHFRSECRMNCLMRITRLNGLFALLLVSGLQAQSPPAPAAVTPRLDTAQARVIVATLQPRTPSIARNGHATNRVLIYLDNGVMTRQEGDR